MTLHTRTEKVTDVSYLKDTFKIGYSAFEPSRKEAKAAWDLYHNRHYTADQLATLANRGQPAETFNIVKMFTRMLLGYYSTTVNTIQASPANPRDIPTSAVLNDIISQVLRDNNMDTEGEKVKLSAIVSGLAVMYADVKDTGETDEFGRPINKVTLEHVPESEIILDPMSRRDDYTDARYIHRFKWLTEEQITALFGKAKMEKLTAYYNFTWEADADHSSNNHDWEVGFFRVHNNYLVVHSVVTDAKGKSWSVYWNDDHILEKTELTYKEVKFPYRVLKTHTSEQTEYYGIFREVAETQRAINQALIKLQLMVNTQKAFVEDGAVENLADFTNQFNRVTAVIPVQNLAGIRIESLSREVLDQYTVIDKALDRIQRVLGINDSFLGMAFASDSARKVKLQQNSSVVALRYLTSRIETFYRYLGWDIANLIKQYYTAHQILRITDQASGDRWQEINKPLTSFTGQIDPQTGQPVMRLEMEEALDPATGKPMKDENGVIIMTPIPEQGTEIAFTKIEIEIHSNNYNDEDEKNQLMLEQVMAGNVGQMLAQVNPAGFFQIAGLSMKSLKTRNSPDIARIFAETAAKLQQDPNAAQQAQGQAQQMPGMLAQQSGPQNGASSRTLNLPQNTNEGVV